MLQKCHYCVYRVNFLFCFAKKIYTELLVISEKHTPTVLPFMISGLQYTLLCVLIAVTL